MKTYFDEATDRRLLEAQSEEEVKAIIAETPEAEKLASKTELVMAELARIKGSVDNELDIDELESAAGGAKMKKIDLSPAQSCIATAFGADIISGHYCSSNDQCLASNEYDYHYLRYSNCKQGGRHDWYEESRERLYLGGYDINYTCRKCNLTLASVSSKYNK